MGKPKKQQKKNDINGGKVNTLLPLLLPKKEGTETRGRKAAITPLALERLREAYLIGCDDDEACSFAEISTMTLYRHQNRNPAFKAWKESLKQQPFLIARKTIVQNLANDPEFALKYMERKKRAEFSPSAKLTIDDTRKLDDENKDVVGNALMEHILRRQAAKAAEGTSHADRTV